MADFSSQMENAYRKHFDAKTNITKREKAGKTLYIAAWIVEIFAVTTGLLIALSNPYQSYRELANPDLMAKVQLFQGMLPLVVIAVVEATKIPLAQGFYMSKMLRWKILFLTSLSFLIFVTFETMSVGLETNFNFTTTRIINEEIIISEKTLAVSDLENQIKSLDEEKNDLENLDEISISQDSQKSVVADNKARKDELAPLEKERDNIRDNFNNRIESLRQKNSVLAQEALNDPRVKPIQQELEQKNRERDNLIKNINNKYSALLDSLNDERQTQAKLAEKAMEEGGFFDDKGIDEINAKLDEVKNEISSKEKEKTDEITSEKLRLDNRINELRIEISKLTNLISSSTKSQRVANEKRIEELEAQKTSKLEDISKDIETINSKYAVNIDITNKNKQVRIKQITERQKRIPQIEQEKNQLLKKIEENNELIRTAKKAKREKIQQNPVFRITTMIADRKCKNPITKGDEIKRIEEKITKQETILKDLEKQSTLLKSTADKQEKVQLRIDKMGAKIDKLYDLEDDKYKEKCPEGIYFERDIANVTKEDTKKVAFIWFGSIAFIISIMGVMLALASFVIRDSQNFKPRKPQFIFNSLKRLIVSFSLLLRKFGRLFVTIGQAIAHFFDGLTHIFDRRIRDGVRRAIIGIRKKAREPKIKTVEVTKEVVVEKEIEVPVEKEKIVFKEVPKEVIRREMIHVPLYSTEHGKVDLDSIKMGEAATDNFTKAQSEPIKTTKDASIKKQSKSKKSSENKSTKKK